ncbi:LamG domain-containing protein [Lutimonas zeaxanthinifaciens]|uniref:LamG domain-containing protein n=1 Tax=Lutimonas zeaxanthinifaciens TaxID=3060215 RepID=UPI00265CC80B|nr:LamG domain-containing protein [Lutimonas sp. YSD2104]WKK66350.1 LamG domain-containing protein [Lutimonas sp. YSD2104]
MKKLLSYLRLLFLIILSLSISGCGDDDGDVIDPKPVDQTFLENYHGTVWKGETTIDYADKGKVYIQSYIRFRDSQTVPAELWDEDPDFDNTCYDSDRLDLKDLGDGGILENLNNKLKVFYTETSGIGSEGETLYSATITFTVQGDNLSVNFVWDDLSNDESGTENYYFKRSSVNPEVLPVCDYNAGPAELPDINIVDLKDDSNWDYCVFGKEDYFFIKSKGSLPESVLYYSSEADKNYSIFFSDDGNIDKVIVDDHIFLLKNPNGNKIDLGVIYPDGNIEVFRDLVTAYDWDNNQLKNQKKSIQEWSDVIRWTGRIVSGVPCFISAWAAVATAGVGTPLALWACGNYLLGLTVDILENEFEIHNGFTDVVDAYGTNAAIGSCSSGVDGFVECASGLTSKAFSQWADHREEIENRNNEVQYADDRLENVSEEEPTENLMAYYPMNGNPNDNSNSRNHGNIYGNALLTEDRFGNVNNAYNFQQSSTEMQYIESSFDYNFNPAGEFSFSIWFNWDGKDFWYKSTVDKKNQTTAYAGLLGIGVNESSGHCYNSGPTRFYLNVWNTGQLAIQYSPGGCNSLNGQSLKTDENLFSSNSWNHAVVTHDGKGNLKIYLNNKLVASRDDHSLDLNNFSSKINIGNFHSYFYSSTYPRGNTRQLFSGKIDDVRIYDRKLSQDEINSLFYE